MKSIKRQTMVNTASLFHQPLNSSGMSSFTEELLTFQCYRIISIYSVYGGNIFVEFQMFSLKCCTDYLITHILTNVYFIQRWKCNNSYIYEPEALLTQASDTDKAFIKPCDPWKNDTHGWVCDPLWVVLKKLLKSLVDVRYTFACR